MNELSFRRACRHKVQLRGMTASGWKGRTDATCSWGRAEGLSIRPSGGDGGWRTADFRLPNCRFMDRCKSADFRLVVPGGKLGLAVARVVVSRVEIQGEKR